MYKDGFYRVVHMFNHSSIYFSLFQHAIRALSVSSSITYFVTTLQLLKKNRSGTPISHLFCWVSYFQHDYHFSTIS